MAIKLGTYDENGTLISPAMPGDKFKTEMENALDKRGDVMVDGATITLGRDPENDMDAMTKKYLNGFISYLNNSPLTEKRHRDGHWIFSNQMVHSEYNKKPLFTAPISLASDGKENEDLTSSKGLDLDGFKIDLSLSNSILGYSSPCRTIDIDVSLAYPERYNKINSRFNFAYWCYLYLKKNGEVVKTFSLPYQPIGEGDDSGYFPNLSIPGDIEPGIYTLGMHIYDLSVYDDTATLTFNPLITVKEQAVLRNIIEY